MSLEDEIRRMGDARADRVTTPSWRDHLGAARRRWPLLATAAAAAIVLAGLAIAFLPGDDDDDADADVADASATTLRRWVPRDGVAEVQFGSSTASLAFVTTGQRVALITTPDDATDPADDDWTWVSVGWPQPLPYELGEDGDPGPRDGYLTYPLGDGPGSVVIVSKRLTEADLVGIEAAVREAGSDVATIAGIIAATAEDVSVVYEGTASTPPVTVSSQPDLGGAIWWLDEPDPLRFTASYRWLLDEDGSAISELFALEDADIDISRDYIAGSSSEPQPVGETEWLEIVDQLLGENPRVAVASADDGGLESLDLASRAATVVASADGRSTVRLQFDEAYTARDGGTLEIVIGPSVTLAFGGFDPGEPYEFADLRASLSEDEARRYVDAINAAVSTTADPTTTTVNTTTTQSTQQTGICAANPVPPDDVLDLATHIAFDRTPLDLDQDGVGDEMLIYDDADGAWYLLVRLQTGWTNALSIQSDVVPSLASTPDGSPAALDLDGDGGLEFLVAGPQTRWGEGVQFGVWMEPEATSDQHDEIRTLLDQPAVLSYEFVDQQETFEEFRDIFADEPELMGAVTADQLPPSYRVVPVDDDRDAVEELSRQFDGRPGVRDVVQRMDDAGREALLQGGSLEGSAIVVTLDGCGLTLW